MMRPRLEAIRDVLSERGALFVSIDDNEAARLRLLLDEVFGEACFLAQVVVNLNPKGRQLGRGFATSHEYVLAYARDPAPCVVDASSAEHVDEADFPLTAADGRRFRHLPLRNTNKKFNPVTAPHAALPAVRRPGERARRHRRLRRARSSCCPSSATARPAVWRWSAPLVDERPDDLVCRVIQGKLGERADVFQRDWLHRDGGRRKKLRTIWLSRGDRLDRHRGRRAQGPGRATSSSRPSPPGWCAGSSARMPADAMVLDPFAGSGTTGHAVALANAADGGTRHCLSINSAEPTRPGSNADLAGLATVAAITRARLRAVDARLGGGFSELPPPPPAP